MVCGMVCDIEMIQNSQIGMLGVYPQRSGIKDISLKNLYRLYSNLLNFKNNYIQRKTVAYLLERVKFKATMTKWPTQKQNKLAQQETHCSEHFTDTVNT